MEIGFVGLGTMGRGIVRNLLRAGRQVLMRFICENRFEHPVAASMSNVAEAVYEAESKYLGWQKTRRPRA